MKKWDRGHRFDRCRQGLKLVHERLLGDSRKFGGGIIKKTMPYACLRFSMAISSFLDIPYSGVPATSCNVPSHMPGPLQTASPNRPHAPNFGPLSVLFHQHRTHDSFVYRINCKHFL